jgi:uncharacterized protein (TIGR02145 family)
MKKATIALLVICTAVFAQQKGTFTDSRDKKTYKTIKIGKQPWMAENLNYEAEGSVCYGDNPDNCAKYGRLYQWSSAKNACPFGWHLPSKDEYQVLYKYVHDKYVGREVAGKKLKAKNGWNENGNGTDDYGFAALPGGSGDSDGSFYDVGNNGNWWSASEYISDDAYSWYMSYNYDYALWNLKYKEYNLFSVRCIQD